MFKLTMKHEDKDKSTFTFHLGIYCYSQMLFNLQNASIEFQSALYISLSKERWKTRIGYIDNFIIFPSNNCQLVEDTGQVLTLLH